MARKKHQTEQKEADILTPELNKSEGVVSQGTTVGEGGSKPENGLETKIRELSDKISELNDKYLRLYSEFDNYRKRTAKEKIDLSRTASEHVITSLLPVLDDMERAIENVSDTKVNDPFHEGLKLIYNKLKAILVQKGLTEIEAHMQPFNTDFHEAVSHFSVEDPEQKSKIIEVLQKGYKLNDKVIRFAKVVVGL